MQTRYNGNIEAIRAVEDCIRATKKYTEGINTMRQHHPVQGEEFSSKAFSKYYEVYPETEISWNMPANTALDWLFSDTPRIDVVFFYDYRSNSAYVRIDGGEDVIKVLVSCIPRIDNALDKAVKTDGKGHDIRIVDGAKSELDKFPSHIHVQRMPK